SMSDFGAANSPTTALGGEHPNIPDSDNPAAVDADPLVTGLRALGHTVSVNSQSSGIGTIVRTELDGESVLTGGADPRREGVVLGDTFMP
nr:gamma-glutamyltransferase [Methylibium sp.]